ncbi:Acyl-ACP thioesterase [Pediococcus damnosus]|uniref:Acyl-ACP thioesterase n=1 Tax=Pediococcus damnosus TaxID=51663 RepID=A0A0R2HFL4_9LACO|nr:acyl-ACP thioesterase domain-containing protein [Pediococcus damnosus]AMV62605.1 Acyl-ACP thioesterase [Pediococcus damnosus]AMV67516.1 Acyl-ACP thioesterase [Pediococcus damnosus]KRN50406.1 fat protein [Pediococcus damnosus]PJE49571.1 acyl-ACP thioesterase [Pediococcus damnosus]GEA93432.1 acyl-ACP thioesterase [Pediococcus damnosus]
MAGKKFSETHRLVYYDGDRTSRASIPMLINLMVLASEDQSEELGVVTPEVLKYGVGWVVTQYSIEINTLPKIGTTIHLSTEATAHNKFFCERHFGIEDESGKPLLEANSNFVQMNHKTRRMGKLIPELIDPYGSDEVKRLTRLPRVQKIPDGQKVLKKQYAVRYFDLDTNGHVNNSHYFEWLLDVLPADFLQTHMPTHLNIQYHKEIQYGHTVVSEVAKTTGENDEMVTLHRMSVNGEIYCEADCSWTSIAN